MALLQQLQNSVSVMRKELQNLRKQIESLRYMLKSEILSIRRRVSNFPQTQPKLISQLPPQENVSSNAKNIVYPCQKCVKSGHVPSVTSSLSGMAVGVVRTCFREKNGTPRQPGLCPSAAGSIRIEAFTNPDHSLKGLEEFSHAWLLFVFHLNQQDSVKAKVKPPRLDGQKSGVFATRSPHRPCPIGLSLVRIDRVVGSTVHVSGVDLVDGTPILDIKPYIPAYDNPQMHYDSRATTTSVVGGVSEVVSSERSHSAVRVASWLETPPVSLLDVEFTRDAEQQLSLFQCRQQLLDSSGSQSGTAAPHSLVDRDKELSVEGTLTPSCSTDPTRGNSPYFLQTFSSLCEARQAVVAVLQQDPRSVYRREKCSQDAYKFSIDNLNISCRFSEGKVMVTDIQPKVLWKE